MYNFQDINNLSRIKERLLSKIKIDNKNKCWNWIGSKTIHNYGVISIRINNYTYYVSTHRLSYYLFNGHIENNLVVRHICNNTLCQNPEHLITGTQQQNINDCVIAKRRKTKLTEQNVLHIIQSIKDGASCYSIAKVFNVSAKLIRDIRDGKKWSYLTNGQPTTTNNYKINFSKTEKMAYQQGYRMDELGTIYNPRGKVLNGHINLGYVIFNIYYHNILYHVRANRFQAYQLFGEKIYEQYIVVRHLNGDKIDNAYNNLELGTQKDNSYDISQAKRKKQAKIANRLTKKLSMEQLKLFWADKNNGLSCRKLAEKYNISQTTAQCIVNGISYKDESIQIKRDLKIKIHI